MKGLAIAAPLWLCAAAPAFAGAVPGLGSTDGYSAQPTPSGLMVLDTHIRGIWPGNSLSAPVLSISTGINEGVEVGVGTSLDFSAPGSNTNRTSVEAVYPWVRASLPLETATFKTALMVGGLIPAYNSLTEPTPGISLLLDDSVGSLTAGLNAGYALGLTTGTNLASLNVHVTWPAEGVRLYEEQFATVAVGSTTTAGIRASLILPIGEQLAFDVTPAAMWRSGSSGPGWSYAPSLGVTETF